MIIRLTITAVEGKKKKRKSCLRKNKKDDIRRDVKGEERRRRKNCERAKSYFLPSAVLLPTICDHKEEEDVEGDEVGDGVVEDEGDGGDVGNEELVVVEVATVAVVVDGVGEGEAAADGNANEAGDSTFFTSCISEWTEVSLGDGVLEFSISLI